MEWFRRRPLFYVALLFSLFIILTRLDPALFRSLWDRIPEKDVYWLVKKEPRAVFLGGVIVSDVETRRTFYGGTLSAFVLEVKRAWVGGEKDARHVSGRARCYLKNIPEFPSYGDEVVLKGDLRPPESLRNPGGFDKQAYLARQGVRTVFYGEESFRPKPLRHGRGNALFACALSAKHFLSDRVSRSFRRSEAAFLNALFFGERSDLEEDFTDLFIKTGTMHILAVSGFNIAFLCAVVFLLLRPFPVSKNARILTALVLVWTYCLVVGWQAPVVRASVMATVFFLGQLLGRKTDALNSLGLAACVILLLNPQAIFDTGFQLSFLAVIGIVRFAPVFLKKPKLLPNESLSWKEKAAFYLEEIFWVSFVCLAVTLPVTVQNFYIVTPLSVLSNLAVVPLSFLLFLTGALFFLSAAWLHPALSWIPFFMSLLMKLFIAVLTALEHIPGAYVTTGRLDGPFLALLILGLAYWLTAAKIRRRVVRAALVLVFAAGVFLAQAAARLLDRPFRMTVLDVGQGDSIYFEFPQGGNLLVDGGKGGEGDKGRRVVAPFLKSKGVCGIDLVVASHPQEDHIGGLAAIVEEFQIRAFAETGSPSPAKRFGELKEKIKAEGARALVLRKGDSLRGFRGVGVEVLGPEAVGTGRRNVNEESLVLRIVYKDTSFLLTGDIQKEAMLDLLKEKAALRSTVLKVPHHGARWGEEGRRFVESVHPSVSVISVGERNPFHHPSARTLEALSAVPGNKIFRTDRDGAVEIVSDGARLDVRTLVRS